MLPKGGDIGVIRCLAGLPDTGAFITGCTAVVTGGSLDVVSEGDAKCDPARSRTIAENMLGAHPDLVGISDAVDLSAQGSLRAVRAANSKAGIGSIGGQQHALKAITADDPNWKITVPYRFETLGKTAVDVAVKVALGEQVDHDVVIPPQPPVTSASGLRALGATRATDKGTIEAEPEVAVRLYGVALHPGRRSEEPGARRGHEDGAGGTEPEIPFQHLIEKCGRQR